MSTGELRVVRGDDGTLVHAPAEPVTPAPGEVVVTIEVVLLGPEDLRGRVGCTVGREAVGVIATVGDGVPDWHPGDRVALSATVPCGDCPACRSGRTTVCPRLAVPGRDVDGWLAATVRVPAHALYHVPPDLDAAEAALVPGAVATAYHALKRAGVGPDVEVAVLGEDAVAAQAVQVTALAGGTAVAFDPRTTGREHALDLGAEEVVDPSTTTDLRAALEAHLGDRVDRVLLTATGAAAAQDALRLLRPGGRLVVVDPHGDASGIAASSTVTVAALVAEDLDVVGSRASTPQDVRELFDLAADARLVLGTTVSASHPVADLDAILTALADPQVLRVAVQLR